jgi:UDP-N-acetylglucosamine:LPS N-acetylglucosamine transferase
LTPESLAERLTSVLSQPALLARAASSARAFAQDNAAKRLADLVCGVIPANGESARNEEKAA